MSLLKAIHSIRSLTLAVQKTGEVKGGGNSVKFYFASFFDVMTALQAPLADNKVSVGFTHAEIHSVPTPTGPTEFVRVTLEVSNGEETRLASYDMEIPEAIKNSQGSSVTNNAQRTANAISYGKRIGLVAFFNISAGNEDDVERMTPNAGQDNIPGLIRVDRFTPWQELTDGVWLDVMSPLEDGKLSNHSERGEEQMKALWRANVTHPGMCAWGADWINRKLQDAGLAWSDVTEMDPALPAFQSCSPVQLRKAAALLSGAIQPKEQA